MKALRIITAGIGIAMISACSEPDMSQGEQTGEESTDQAAPEASVDLSEYGLLDGGQVSPIAMPGWLPDGFPLPDDFVALDERSIGTRTRIMRGVTDQSGDGLFDSISQNLQSAGYEVRDGESYRADNLVYFSGKGYEDSTIRIRPGDGGSLLEISLSKSE